MNDLPAVCPLCGHKRQPTWAKAVGVVIGVLTLALVVVLLVALLVAAVRWIA
jgi:hypothetical protein